MVVVGSDVPRALGRPTRAIDAFDLDHHAPERRTHEIRRAGGMAQCARQSGRPTDHADGPQTGQYRKRTLYEPDLDCCAKHDAPARAIASWKELEIGDIAQR